MLMISRIFAIVMCILFASCANSPNALTSAAHRFEVSATSDGTPVNNLDQELVHHVDVSERDVAEVSEAEMPFKLLGYKTSILKDSNDQVTGILLNLKAENEKTSKFGFQHGDLIIGVGGSLVKSESEVNLIFVQLKQKKTLSVSVQRDGMSHKVILYVGKNRETVS